MPLRTLRMSNLSTNRKKNKNGKLPVSSSTIWAWIRAGEFPPPIKLSARVSVWPEEIVDAWLEAKLRTKSTLEDEGD